MPAPGVKNLERYASLLRRCGNARALSEGKQVHADIVRNGHGESVYLGELLIQMYGKCATMEDARAVFDALLRRSVLSWNFMIAAYARNGHYTQALDLFEKMGKEGVLPNEITYASVLAACAGTGNLAEGKLAHARLVDEGFLSAIAVQNALVSIYAKCGQIEVAKKVFDRMQRRDVITWNAMIAAYAQEGYCKDAIQLYRHMDNGGFQPNEITLAGVLGACSGLEDLAEGKRIHERIIFNGFQSVAIVETALINMYGKCGMLDLAKGIFDRVQKKNVFSWTALIAAHAQRGHNKEALELYERMCREEMHPNVVTFASILSTCSSPEALEQGKAIHARIVSVGLESRVIVQNALLTMYAKCGSLDGAITMFNCIQHKNVVSWTSMIAAYTQYGHHKEALDLFEKLEPEEGLQPNDITFASVLAACSSLGALLDGQKIHALIISNGFQSSIVAQNALVNMYGKCGCLDVARSVFKAIQRRNVVSWNVMLAAYAQHGHIKVVLDLCKDMSLEGVQPNDITFLSILIACSQAGLLKEGQQHFVSMRTDHSVAAKIHHYVCMVDLLGRSGRLHEAEELLELMPFQPDAVAWMTLLSACRIHGDLARGRHVAAAVFNMDFENVSPFVLMLNIHAQPEFMRLQGTTS